MNNKNILEYAQIAQSGHKSMFPNVEGHSSASCVMHSQKRYHELQLKLGWLISVVTDILRV